MPSKQFLIGAGLLFLSWNSAAKAEERWLAQHHKSNQDIAQVEDLKLRNSELWAVNLPTFQPSNPQPANLPHDTDVTDTRIDASESSAHPCSHPCRTHPSTLPPPPPPTCQPSARHGCHGYTDRCFGIIRASLFSSMSYPTFQPSTPH